MSKAKLDSVSQRPTFQVVIRAEPRGGDEHDQDGLIRLRRTLKALLRGWGWRCVAVDQVKPKAAAKK